MKKNRKKSSKVGLKNGRVDWNVIENLDCLTLIDHGLHAKVIAKATGLTMGQVYGRARASGQRLRDYRNGKGAIGAVLFKKFTVSNMTNGAKTAVRLATKSRVIRIVSAKKKSR